MADPVRVAVVGSGYFGRFHADHYARNPRAKLVAVVDTDAARAEFLRGLEAEFAQRRFTNAADAFDTVKAFALDRAARFR